MAEDLLELSSRIIDDNITDLATNRITQELSELTDGVAVVESFSHVVVLRTEAGLVAFDSSGERSGAACVEAVRAWSTDPFHTLVYTHGHMDHVGGSGAFAADASAGGTPVPRVLGHERVEARLERYEMTNGYNQAINLRQFGGVPRSTIGQLGVGGARSFVAADAMWPDVTYDATLTETIGNSEFVFNHALGETDDHTWTWVPDHKLISAGDLFIWNFPNCGNPQKVQRYPLEWVAALRAMAMQGAELFVPAHGLPVSGAARIERCLTTVANTLEKLATDVVGAMNTGARLDEILHEVTVDSALLELPFLRPLYDEPEFVIHNLWRLYGGWWDGNPARLKPAPDATVASEIAMLAGGALALAQRAVEVAEGGDLRLACHLVEMAGLAEPESREVHTIRSEVYERRRKGESSLMSKGIYASARAESDHIATGEVQKPQMNFSLGNNN